MKIDIFNVEHGQCAMIYCPNGKKVMIDAGHNASKEWYPHIHFFGQEIEHVISTNIDEDHASDLHNVLDYCKVNTILVNPTINSRKLALMKDTNGIGNGGIKRIHDLMT